MRRSVVPFAVMLAVLGIGCGGDMSRTLVNNAQLRENVFKAIAGNPELTQALMDRLIASDTTRTVVMEKVLSHGPTAQALMLRIAQKRDMLEGIINVAVQDSTTRDQMMTLFRGMEMAAPK